MPVSQGLDAETHRATCAVPPLGPTVPEPTQIQGNRAYTLFLNRRSVAFFAILKLQNLPHGILKG